MFDSREYEYADVSFSMLGYEFKGLRGITYKKKQEKEAITGQGNNPKAVQRGQKGYEGSLMILESDFDQMTKAAQAAGYEDIIDVPGNLINGTCVFSKDGLAGSLKKVVISNIEFSEFEGGMKTGDKFKEYTLPYIALGVKTSLL